MSHVLKEIREARLARIEGMIPAIAEKHGVTREEMFGRSRMAIIVGARNELMAQAWRSGIPLIEIARLFGRDHTGVMHGVKKALGPEVYRREMLARNGYAPDLKEFAAESQVKLRVAS